MIQTNQRFNLKLDHVFIRVEPRAKVADCLLEQGFREGPSNTHPGQGKSCCPCVGTIKHMPPVNWIPCGKLPGWQPSGHLTMALTGRNGCV